MHWKYTHFWGGTPRLFSETISGRRERPFFAEVKQEVRVNKLIGFEEVSRLTSVPASTIRKMVTRKKIPCIRIGKHVRFDEEDIVSWIERSKVGAGEDEGRERGKTDDHD